MKVTARASRPALPFLPTTDTFFTLLRASGIIAAFSTCSSLDKYVFSPSYWAGYTWTRFFVSPAEYRAFNLDRFNFKYRLTEFWKPCILRGFQMYLNSESKRFRSSCTASSFCPSQSTVLMSRSRGTKLRTASSHPFFLGHAPSISPVGFTLICFAFWPTKFHSALTSLLCFCL
jgi:hypothetical protein